MLNLRGQYLIQNVNGIGVQQLQFNIINRYCFSLEDTWTEIK